MSKLMSECVRTTMVEGQACEVYGCFDSDAPYPGLYDFYDVFTGETCLNEGAPFFNEPNDLEIARLIKGEGRAS